MHDVYRVYIFVLSFEHLLPQKEHNIHFLDKATDIYISRHTYKFRKSYKNYEVIQSSLFKTIFLFLSFEPFKKKKEEKESYGSI